MPIKTKQAVSEELRSLLNEKGSTCVSVVVALHNLSIDQKADKLHLAKAIKEASDILTAQYSDESEELIASLIKLQEKIRFNRNDEGVGLYVSKQVSFYSTFPFPLSEKTVVDKSFRVKELLIKEQYSIPYSVLYIDEKEIRLYAGKLNQLDEIRNGTFPMLYEENYEYQSPSRSTSFSGSAHVKSFEKDKHELEHIRHKSFLDQADELLYTWLQNSEMLVLCGVKRYISEFVNQTIHAEKIASVLYGNYSRFTESDFSAMVWPSVKAYIDEKIIDEMNELNEKTGEGMTEEGIIPVWEAVASGRGKTLLVEEGLETKGFLEERNSWQLHLHAPRQSHTELPDAVNELLQMTLEKNGKIVFVEDGMLNKRQHIALVTRF